MGNFQIFVRGLSDATDGNFWKKNSNVIKNIFDENTSSKKTPFKKKDLLILTPSSLGIWTVFSKVYSWNFDADEVQFSLGFLLYMFKDGTYTVVAMKALNNILL